VRRILKFVTLLFVFPLQANSGTDVISPMMQNKSTKVLLIGSYYVV
jgi:hypothetical protein